jgi:hypothetical protein
LAKGSKHMQCPNCLFHETYADGVRYESVSVPVTPKRRVIHAVIGGLCAFAVLDTITWVVSMSLGTTFGFGITFIVINLFVAAVVAYGCYTGINTVNKELEVGSHWVCQHCAHTWTIERGGAGELTYNKGVS